MEEQKQLKIKAKDDDLKGSYSNLMQVVHTRDEFILDFFMASPPQGILCSRIIMNPGHVKRMLRAIEENISKYEEKFGKIEESEAPKTDSGQGEGIGFRPDAH
ncbi:DUF3467 domain-containing protein [Candidatus Parcubacteria bacterium]|jgi:hypothetical protein|nr:DUF3467 domain-containing protein [Candidatus Parcubacteria bacterium]